MVICIIQARTGSTRLPGKVLKKVCGKTMLELELERVKNSTLIDKIIVATTNFTTDDSIVEICKSVNVEYFRGSEDDVLERYYKAASSQKLSGEDCIVRITGDCPLIDPEITDEVIELFLNFNVDYMSNTNPPTFPDGLDVEVFKFNALEKAWKEAKLSSEREHVTPFIKNHNEYFTHANLKYSTDLSHLRLTLDEAEDLELIEFVFESLYSINSSFTLKDILELMRKKPHEFQKNSVYMRNEGYYKSIMNDKIVKTGE